MLPQVLTPIPGPRSQALAERLRTFEARGVTYLAPEFPVFWERAEGTNVWDVDGNRFLDFSSAFAVAGLGHGARVLGEALVAQADRLIHAMGDVHPPDVKVDLCEALSRVTFERWGAGCARTLLCNSGSEAVEAALKTALLHNGKPGVVSFSGGYHGLGYGALETAGLPFFREPFCSQLAKFSTRLPYPGCGRCPYGCTAGFRLEGTEFPNCSSECLRRLEDELEEVLRKRDVGCVLAEPVQGRGGDIVPPRDFLVLLRRVCDRHKVLLILDEIYTGFHRTGKFFACEHSGVIPDIICLGKGLSGGFPIAACVGRADVMDAWPVSKGEALHTSTTLGNPLGCAMAVAAIRAHESGDLGAKARSVGRHLRAGLLALGSKAIREVRGVGAMVGAELTDPFGNPNPSLAGRIVTEGLANGFILLAGGPDGNVLSFAPPFGLAPDETDCLLAWLREFLQREA